MDKITEVIAHFIGLFEITSEEGRARSSYREFHQNDHTRAAVPQHDGETVVIRAPHTLEDFEPYIPYRPLPPVIEPAASAPLLTRTGHDIEIPLFRVEHAHAPVGRFFNPSTEARFSSERERTIDPPGSVVVLVQQHAILSDDDFVSLGDHGLALTAHGLSWHLAAAARLDPLVASAEAIVPFTVGTTLPGSSAEIRDFVLSQRAAWTAYEAPDHSGASVSLLRGGAFSASGSISGLYVNGALAAEAPDFKSFRPDPPADDEEDDVFQLSHRPGGASGDTPHEPAFTAVGTQAEGVGPVVPEASVDLDVGGNTLVNNVELTSNWLAATVTAVLGDHYEMNAIVQVNAWSDADSLSTAFGGAAAEAAAIGYNIASFRHIDPSEGRGDDGDVDAGAFPRAWVVTKVTGDLLIMNWIEQIAFMSDNDISILSSTGNKTAVLSGGNTSINSVSLTEIGHYYDLIVVGGSVYDANMIYQMNVMLDDDAIGARAGFSSGADSSLAAGDNLLWNEANIVNVGAADRFGALPEAYRETAAKLAVGDKTISKDVLQDPAFQGLGALRVLYISGDIINLQFVKQTNVLGDVDHVWAAAGQAQAAPDAQWTVSAGANTLVNAAGIADVDALGKTLVGGSTYSDEILVQANFISNTASHGAPSGDALVSEAVAFLSDGMLTAMSDLGDLSGIHASFPMGNAAGADPMHILA